MYKKTHTQAKGSLAEPYCRKGSFACLVPLRVIMLTLCAYRIQNFFRRNSIILYRIIRGILYKKKEELM